MLCLFGHLCLSGTRSLYKRAHGYVRHPLATWSIMWSMCHPACPSSPPITSRHHPHRPTASAWTPHRKSDSCWVINRIMIFCVDSYLLLFFPAALFSFLFSPLVLFLMHISPTFYGCFSLWKTTVNFSIKSPLHKLSTPQKKKLSFNLEVKF